MFSEEDIVGLVLVYSYVTLIIAFSVHEQRVRPSCDYRKIVHILVGNIVFIWWIFDNRYVMAFLAAAPFVLLLLLVTPYSPLKNVNISFLKNATQQGHGLGLVYYAISWTLLAFFLFDDRMVASIAILAMSYGDGVGGLVGKRYGTRKLWKEKSVIGTSAVFVATFLATLTVILFYTAISGFVPTLFVPELDGSMAVSVALLTGAFVAVVELFSPGEYDNLIVPLSTASLLIVLGL